MDTFLRLGTARLAQRREVAQHAIRRLAATNPRRTISINS